MKRNTSLILAALAFVTTTTQAGTIISETFSGSDSVALVGAPTPDGNNWTGAEGEAREENATTKEEDGAAKEEDGAAKEEEPTGGAPITTAPTISVKQDGSTSGRAFTAYHKFTLKQGQAYTLEAVLSPANKADNQWFTVGFALTADNGDSAPQLDGGTTYAQTVLSGSGYRYGWTGPNAKDMCELRGPGLHNGPVKVVLDTTSPSDYTIELFDGEGDSMHGPKSIGAPAITQVFIGNSGAGGRFSSFKLSDDSAESATSEKKTSEATTPQE